MMRVIGREVISARLKSSANAFEIALSALAPPNSSTLKPGWAWSSLSTAASGAATASSGLSPGSSKVTRADLPSSDSVPSLPRA